MRCFVSFCGNDSTDSCSKSKGISFHLLPTEATQRTKWIDALGHSNDLRLPMEQVYVCSEHFYIDDLYESNGLKRAVPKAVSIKVCRICLTTEMDNHKLISMKLFKLEKIYQNLTGVVISKNDKLPQSLCTECAYRLITFKRFRRKSLRSKSIMLKLLDEHQTLTLKSLMNINREKNQLKSDLNYKHYSPDYCDSHVIENDLQTDIQTNEQKLICEVDVVSDVKNEDQIFIDESIESIKEEYKENVIVMNNDIGITNDTDLDNGIITEMDNENVKDELSNDDYSSDDSRPIVLLKKAKDVKRKKVSVTKRKGRQKKPLTPYADMNEKNFTISEDLSFEEQVANLKKRSETANFKNAPFKCMECFKGFLDEDAYTSHMARHTDECGPHACLVCKLHFKRPEAVRHHGAVNHAQRFRCRECPDFVTTHRQTARLHERWHKGTQYQCPYCPEVFQRATTYMSHKRIKHPTDFICTLCGFSFVSAKGLHMHKNLKHRLDDHQIPEDGPHCEPCGLRFLSRDALQQHLLVSTKHSADSEGNNTKGPVKRTRNERRYVRRAQTSLAKADKIDGPISCEQCGVQLKDSRAYHSHFRKSHPDKNRTVYLSMKAPCMCEVCGGIFQSIAHLKEHGRAHTEERPFACDQCGKRFRAKQSVRLHQARSHGRVRPAHECDACGKRFSDRSNLMRHKFIHTGLKPFKCETCGKCFTTRGEKKTHIDYVHLKKPWPKRNRGTKPAVSSS